jgi:cation diffusion facilitator CzcD-associated flavoprotein CzcO
MSGCRVEFAALKVAVVGGGDSGAQIAAGLVLHASLTWMTRRPPRYLRDAKIWRRRERCINLGGAANQSRSADS